MKNSIKIVLFILPILLVSACKKDTYNLNSEFTLDFKQTAIVNVNGGQWEIQFVELLEESRCPPGAVCFWAGQVAVRIQINKTTKFDLGFHTSIPSTYQHQNHLINLVDVSYNKDKNFGEEKHCSIRLRVDE